MTIDRPGHDDSPAGRILNHLRQFGACNIKDMVSALGVTRTAVRQPLGILVAQGLVTTRVVRDGRGRPPLFYDLSDKARKVASPWLERLALVMLEEVLLASGVDDSTPLQRLLLQLEQHYIEHLDGTTPIRRLQQLREWLDQHDIPSDLAQAGETYELTTYGCPYYGLANRHREVCQSEVKALEQALGAPLALVQSHLDGHQGCCFRMQKAT